VRLAGATSFGPDPGLKEVSSSVRTCSEANQGVLRWTRVGPRDAHTRATAVSPPRQVVDADGILVVLLPLDRMEQRVQGSDAIARDLLAAMIEGVDWHILSIGIESAETNEPVFADDSRRNRGSLRIRKQQISVDRL